MTRVTASGIPRSTVSRSPAPRSVIAPPPAVAATTTLRSATERLSAKPGAFTRRASSTDVPSSSSAVARTTPFAPWPKSIVVS